MSPLCLFLLSRYSFSFFPFLCFSTICFVLSFFFYFVTICVFPHVVYIIHLTLCLWSPPLPPRPPGGLCSVSLCPADSSSGSRGRSSCSSVQRQLWTGVYNRPLPWSANPRHSRCLRSWSHGDTVQGRLQ